MLPELSTEEVPKSWGPRPYPGLLSLLQGRTLFPKRIFKAVIVWDSEKILGLDSEGVMVFVLKDDRAKGLSLLPDISDKYWTRLSGPQDNRRMS